MKTNDSTSQLEKGFVGNAELFPANEQSAPPIEPGEESFNDPSSRLFGFFQVVRGKLLLGSLLEGVLIPSMVAWVQTNMRFIATFIPLAVERIGVIGGS